MSTGRVKRNVWIVVTVFAVTIKTDSHLCAIYDKRPQICRVEDQYLLNYQSQYSWQEFIALNQAACLILNKL